MPRCLFPALAAFVLLVSCPRMFASSPPLGLNLAGVVDWSAEIVFVDVFKAARPWISQAKGKPWGQGGPLETDGNGNVLSLREGQFAESIVFTDFADRFPSGTFTSLYDGAGDLDFGGDARPTDRRPGRIAVEIKPRTGMVTVRILRTDAANPIRNIRLIMPGFESSYQDQPFTPEFLKRWQGIRVFRFMDWGRTNNSRIREWSERPTPAMHSQAVKGVAVEYMVQLCNQLDVEPWFCMPHLASDDYVRQFALLVKQRLKPSLKVYVEYSNECWNSQFEQARYCQEQGKNLQLSKNAYEAQLRFYAQRSLEVFASWEAVFGGKDRLVRVLATQSANPWTGATVLDWKDAGRHADAIAIAPYFGHRWGSPRTVEKVAAMTVDELVKALHEDVAQSRKAMEAYAREAKKRNLRLFAYEGGQHLAGYQGAENDDRLTRLFHAANRHPGMRDLYRQNLADWQEAGGDLFCVFSSLGRYSKWGSWGLLEYAGQAPEQTPKFEAIKEYLRNQERQR